MRILHPALARVAVYCLFVTSATAQVPQLINYQGRLLNGTNLHNGSVGLSLRLFNVPSGGAAIYEDSNSVTVVDGLYSTFLGDNTTGGSLSLALTNAQLWLEAAVDGTALAPRERIASVAYALNAWQMNGNTGTVAGAHFLGTTDNQVFELRTFNQRVARFDTATNSAGALIPNVILGHSANLASNVTAFGSVIGGGGNNPNPQIVGAAYDTIAGGVGNRATGGDSTVAGGRRNEARGLQSFIGGGTLNVASGSGAMVPGGLSSVAAGDTSFAAGRQAKATNAGAFVWADSTAADFSSTASNQFLIRAAGGVGIGTNVTPAMLTVAGSVQAASYSGDGAGVTNVNAQTLQGNGPAAFAAAAHAHSGADITSGTVADARIDSAIARDAEIMPTVLANDGSSSTLDADLLDGMNSTAFSTNGHQHSAVDITSGTLNDARLSSDVAHVNVAETLAANWVNTANPWADNEVSDTLTVGAGSTVSDGALSANVSLLGPSIDGSEIANGTVSNADVAANTFWGTGGNTGTTAGTHFLGTPDNQAFEMRTFNQRVARFDTATNSGGALIPNVILGHSANLASNVTAFGSVVGGGGNAGNPQIVGAAYDTIAGGVGNRASGGDSTVAGGRRNTASGLQSLVGGGGTNVASAEQSTVVGGQANTAAGVLSIVAGGLRNTIYESGGAAFIGGGELNTITTAQYGTIGGGFSNTIMNGSGFIGGGNENLIGDESGQSTISGGDRNRILANSQDSVIGGGSQNTISNSSVRSTIGGGLLNIAAGNASFVGGGFNNHAIADDSVAVGGYENTASDYSATVGGGQNNVASNQHATVPGGLQNTAGGLSSFAAGRQAKALHDGAFVWGDSTAADFASTANNQFLIRAGGVGIGTNVSPEKLTVAGNIAPSVSNTFSLGTPSLTWAALHLGSRITYFTDLAFSRLGVTNMVLTTNGNLTVTGTISGNGSGLTGLSGGSITAGTVSNVHLAANAVDSSKIQDGSILFGDLGQNSASSGQAMLWNGSAWTNGTVSAPPAWQLGGNAGTTNGVHFVGTTDDEPLDVRAFDMRVAQFRSTTNGFAGSQYATITMGSRSNLIDATAEGSTIAGGGYESSPNIINANNYMSFIGGGDGNIIDANAYNSVIVGGSANRVDSNASYSAIGGGSGHIISGEGATVAGGSGNQALTENSTVGGGYYNVAAGSPSSDDSATVGGGYQNLASGDGATVGGGNGNTATNDNSTVGGGSGNRASGSAAATVGGGSGNTASGDFATVPGGSSSIAAGDYAFAAGYDNQANEEASVALGADNRANGLGSAVLGGINNIANKDYATIAGGRNAKAYGEYSTVGGGVNSIASNDYATVSGGNNNSALSEYATVGGGSGNRVIGQYGTVPGGNNNTAGNGSFAVGRQAKATNGGSFVWADGQAIDFGTTTFNQFLIRAQNGVGIGTNITPEALTVAGNIAPSVSNTFSLGSPSLTWAALHLGSRITYNTDLSFSRQGVTNMILTTNGNLSVAGNISGNGSGLTGIGGASLATGAISNSHLAANAVDSSKIQDASVAFADLGQNGAANGQAMVWNGAAWTNAAVSAPPAWQLGGNANTTNGTHFVGTTDDTALDLRVNNSRGFRIESVTNFGVQYINIIGGSVNNVVDPGAFGSTIGGGGDPSYAEGLNRITAEFATIAGGQRNEAGGSAFVGGGFGNEAQGYRSVVVGGAGNQALDEGGVVVGGVGSVAGKEGDFVGGGANNNATGSFSVVAGGSGNNAGREYNAVGGGEFNAANGGHTVVAGGGGNSASAQFATIGGGNANSIGNLAYASIVGGGEQNTISTSAYAVIVGGSLNAIRVNADYASIAAGYDNVISNNAAFSTISGGQGNRVADGAVHAVVGGGFNNNAGGIYATVPGGQNNDAANTLTLAAGNRAKAVHPGAFVWGDASDENISSTNDNSVTMRASGGYRLFSATNLAAGVELAPGSGSWTALSDANAKKNFEPVDGRDVIEKLAAMPIQKWTYKTQDDSVRHIGPTAQDFNGAFGVGDRATGITGVDADGVALAAIQELIRQNRSLQERVAVLEKRVGGDEGL